MDRLNQHQQGSYMGTWKEYSAIKQLIDQYFYLKEDESYEDFIKKLTDILKL